MTLAQLIEAAAQRMQSAGVSFGHGTTNAEDEAAWLVLWSLGLPLDSSLDASTSQDSETLAPTQISKALELVDKRIATRKPAAYLTQEAWLQGMAFYVDERVIVPRSLIAELLVDGSIDYWLKETIHSVLDLCTGNGSLAVIAATVFPEVHVEAADISRDALDVARINVAKYGLDQRVLLRESDGLGALNTSGGAPQTYDLIICNPPYVNAESMATLPDEYLAEPRIALDGNQAGGSDGMDFIRRLLSGVAVHMNPGAVLLLEIGNERPFFETAFPNLEAVWLETSAGDDQVLLIPREALTQ
jgi:ribosomal protein L3 glutamine methyltransferase